MSPATPVRKGLPQRFPRVSGDEPGDLEKLGGSFEFSPRERG